jgi:hypothetical protein
MDDELPNAGCIKAFIYRYAPEPVRNWMADNAAIARITESLKQDLVRTGEWAKAPGDRTVPDAAWQSYQRFLDDRFKGQGLEAAWEAHERRMGTHIVPAEPVRGDLWQQTLQAGHAARAAAAEPAPVREPAAERQL